ncbi:MAG TPA: DUF1080 domain-containing protein [Bryobacteraceae bacterium]|jgi:hypothetical protein|nr:DUF1080 domain-containing protein [Bryobacteraceae bacterium]
MKRPSVFFSSLLAGSYLLAGSLVAQDVGTPFATRIDPKWKISDRSRPMAPVVTPGTPSTQQKAGLPPSDATVLFDGKDLAGWVDDKGNPARWTVGDGYFQTSSGGGDIHTTQAFGDCQLHVEWQTPNPPHGKDQDRGNSGIYLMGLYELQVLDSYGSETYADGQAGAIYAQHPPQVNVTLPPGQWQTYDVIFHGPRFSASGELIRPATATVLQNGVLIQDNAVLTGPTDYMHRPPYKPTPEKLPLKLQDHHHPVKYRNIWIRELKEK